MKNEKELGDAVLQPIAFQSNIRNYDHVVGLYENELDELGNFSWCKKNVFFSNLPSSDENIHILDVPSDLSPLHGTAKTENGDQSILFSNGFNILPKDIISLHFNDCLSITGETRELVAKFRILSKNKKLCGFNISHECKQIYSAADSKTQWITKIVFSGEIYAGTYDLIATGNQTDKIEISGEIDSFQIFRNSKNFSFHFTNDRDRKSLELIFDSFLIINNIKRRTNWFDFYCLESEYEKTKSKSDNAKNMLSSIPLFVQWYVTWKCNYKCHYCWQESNPEFYRNAPITKESPEKWAQAFNLLQPEFLYLTGGEPTLYKKLPEMISLLDKTTKLIMTTNLGYDLNMDKFLSLVSPSQFEELMVSYHPTQVSQEVFKKRIVQLVESGFLSLGIEMVLNPSNLNHLDFIKNIVSTYNLKIRLDDFHPVSGVYYPTENEKLLTTSAKNFALYHNKKINIPDSLFSEGSNYNRTDLIDNSEITEAIKFRDYVYCGAGSRKITVDGYGDVYACTSSIDRSKLFGHASLPHYQVLGNILNGSFKWLDRPFLCREAFRCSACDYEVLDKAWCLVPGLPKYPIPE